MDLLCLYFLLQGKRWTVFAADSEEAYDDDDDDDDDDEEEEDSGCANCRLQVVVVPSSFLDRYGGIGAVHDVVASLDPADVCIFP
ncbi:hypothetical protein QYF36_022936 [Acer negundo]|nr:hypothetical protein QYF36_022936 [Acer negundo]